MTWKLKVLVCGLPALCRCEHRTTEGYCGKTAGPISDLPDCRQCISISCDSSGDCTIGYSREVQRFASIAACVKELAEGGNL